MHNPYAPPQSLSPALEKDSGKPGIFFWLTVAATLLLGVGLGLLGAFGVPGFKEVFAAFGADLPWQTLFVLDYRHGLWLPFLATSIWLVFWFFPPSPAARQRVKTALLVPAALCLGGWAFALWALYSPIFKLGAL